MFKETIYDMNRLLEHLFCPNDECRYEKKTFNADEEDDYCPDCGEYLEKFVCDGWDGEECSCEFEWE